jgi:hypothetical protein
MNHIIPDWIKDSIITDCKDVEEFAYKYRKPDRFTGRGEDYAKCIMESHERDLKERGYTSISQHDNLTGKFITYVEKESVK